MIYTIQTAKLEKQIYYTDVLFLKEFVEISY